MRKLLDNVGGAIVAVDIYPHEFGLFAVMWRGVPAPHIASDGTYACPHEVPCGALIFGGEPLPEQGPFHRMERLSHAISY
jgi:hypothetical protein